MENLFNNNNNYKKITKEEVERAITERKEAAHLEGQKNHSIEDESHHDHPEVSSNIH